MTAVRKLCSAMLSDRRPGDPPAGPPVPLEQAHLVQEVGQALDLGLRLRHVSWLGSRVSGCRVEVKPT